MAYPGYGAPAPGYGAPGYGAGAYPPQGVRVFLVVWHYFYAMAQNSS